MVRLIVFIHALSILCSELAAAEKLSGKELLRRIETGNIQIYTGSNYEFPVNIIFRANGSIEGVSVNGYYDQGRWWLRGDTLCHQWQAWFDGKRQCHFVYKTNSILTLTKP